MLVFDLALHTAPRQQRRAIDRYAASPHLTSGMRRLPIEAPDVTLLSGTVHLGDLDLDKDDLPGANHDWLEYIIERFEMGRDASPE